MPIEQIRKRFAADLHLYPTLDEKKVETHSVVSVPSDSSDASSRTGRESISAASSTSRARSIASSTGMSSTVAAPTLPRLNKHIVISSDEDSHDEVEHVLTRFTEPKIHFPEPEIPSGAGKVDYPRAENFGYKPVPTEIRIPSNMNLPPTEIRVPSNMNLPPPTRPPMQDFSVPEMEPVTNMTADEADKALKELIAGSVNEGIEAEINPDDLVVSGFREDFRLLPHQALGRVWMRERETGKKAGGILADDMGLGKTIQTLTRIVDGRARKSDAAAGWSASTLVVCPLALVNQWAKEVKSIAPAFTALIHHGTNRSADPSAFRSHVVITTYDVLKSEYEAYQESAKDEVLLNNSDDDDEGKGAGHAKPKQKPRGRGSKKAALFKVNWWRVVLDEAHNIKNEKSKGAIACYGLKAKYRWCLTGTPMQNNVQELFSLFKFLRVQPFNDWQTFNTQIAKPLKARGNVGRAMKRLQVVLREIMLRRTKDQTLNGQKLIELPDRNVNVVSCTFDPAEQVFYKALETKMSDTLEKLMATTKGNSSYISVLLLLLRLRQTCDHPMLVTKDYKNDYEAIDPRAVQKGTTDKDGDADDLVAAFDQLGVTRKCQFCMMELSPSNAAEGEWENACIDCVPLALHAQEIEKGRPSSAKIRKILEILQDIEERSDGVEKTIVFSQFTSMLDLIEPFLKDERIRYVRYDGSMKTPDREAALSKIREDPKTRVILISFKAGSTGLNLTACNNVILVDMWWNPALEDQAFDRAHRFGQTRDVNIFKLKIDNTVEDRILELQERKRTLARAALSGMKLKDMRLGFDELLALFKGKDEDSDEESE
ncbi:hypothetical protein APHAL10511_007295 [Amanita phalloides]|nr:hypothetical protein APHAL10511_007295 [Amanita phalloides]